MEIKRNGIFFPFPIVVACVLNLFRALDLKIIVVLAAIQDTSRFIMKMSKLKSKLQELGESPSPFLIIVVGCILHTFLALNQSMSVLLGKIIS